MFNSRIRGWINYYGRFCPSALYPTLRRIDLTLARWAERKVQVLARAQAAIPTLAGAHRMPPSLGCLLTGACSMDSGRTMGAG